MICNMFILMVVFPVVQLQSTIDIDAGAKLSDGSFANGAGDATGYNVQGSVEVFVDDDISSSSVILSADGRVPPKFIKLAPQQMPEAIHKKVSAHPSKVYVKAEPKCEDLKDDQCYQIYHYPNCGFCKKSKYPSKGYGCSYIENITLKGTNKKVHEYETKHIPNCNCDGEFIYDKHACPLCDYFLSELGTCVGTELELAEIEVSKSCLKTVGFSQKELHNCGYAIKHDVKPTVLKKDKAITKESGDHKVILKKIQAVSKPSIVKKQKEDTIVTLPKNHVSSVASAFASAIAIASEQGSSAIAKSLAIASSGNGL
eukprot:TRINITY_DN17909_c0_g1_i6.p1 TRINITY_DN17909_c0_g1~~TRINITY_DN17909_c0_g1_i6.p1  ORF type:complete len:332 (+),score=34.24 TRINITY_DN17909_c0_g1_i6:57-998(+)